MTTPITMPQLGETVLEGTVIKWLKQPGESIAVDDPLLEISTDKVDTEIPSPVAGVLKEILVQEGETVDVGTQLALVDDGGEKAADSGTSAAKAPGPAAKLAIAPAASGGTGSGPAALASAGDGSRLSPIVRKLVAENGIDVSQLTGSGAGGRISKRDVLAYLATRGAGAAGAGAGDAPSAATSAPRLQSVPPAGPLEEVVPLSHIRKAIASHMHESLQVSARAWTLVEVDMENIARLRDSAKEAFSEREGFGLTYMPFLSRAVCEALLEFPQVNAELRGDELVLRRYVNLGIAVSYEDGLIVPVVRQADSMNLAGLARSINDLAVRARNKQLKPDDVAGGTFTITNPGPFGSVMSLPIINQPQSAILSFDAIQKRPVVVDDAIAIRRMVYLSMSWDHRVLDGALATQFLGKVKEHLETWDFAEDLQT